MKYLLASVMLPVMMIGQQAKPPVKSVSRPNMVFHNHKVYACRTHHFTRGCVPLEATAELGVPYTPPKDNPDLRDVPFAYGSLQMDNTSTTSLTISNIQENGCPWGFYPAGDTCTLHLVFAETPLVICAPLNVVMDGDKVVRQEIVCTVPKQPKPNGGQ